MGKAIQITDEAYGELVKGRQVAIDKAKERGDLDTAEMLVAMGIGSFAGYLIYKELAKVEKDTGTHIIK
ncbi:hypothetical protein ES706_04767 [subsurface metagenome]